VYQMFFGQLGHWILDKIRFLLLTFSLILQAIFQLFALGRTPVRQVLLRQIYFTGLESTGVVMVMALTIGVVIVTQSILLLGNSNVTLVAKVLCWIVIRELGPLLTALVVIARSGAAIAAELANMQVTGQIDSLRALGISPCAYLVLPRLLGGALSVFALTIYFDASALLGGFFAAFLGWKLPSDLFFQGLYGTLTVGQIVGGACKSLLFGLIIAAVACQRGLIVERSSTAVPRAATQAVIYGLFLVFVADGCFALLFQILSRG